MPDILPADYSSKPTIPQVLGKAGSVGTVLQMAYEDGTTQLVLDKNLSATSTLRVTGFGPGGTIDPKDLSFHYQPLDNRGSAIIPVTVTGEPELQADGSYLITTTIPSLLNAVDGHLVATYLDGAVSDGLAVAQAPYPALPEALVNDGASRQILLDYENLIDVLAPPNSRSNTGTVQSSFSKKGLNALENKDDTKRKEAIQGAVQQAVGRIRGLSEVLAIHHLGDEFVKMQTWTASLTGLGILSPDVGDLATDLTSLVEYAAGVTQDLVKLTSILDQYGISLKGATTTQNSAVVNQAAQAFRYTSNSVFDIEAPTTLLNTEYLIQQSSRGTYRQTGTDQLSCFDSWQRAEDNMVKQSKNQYNYASGKIYNGALGKTGSYGSGFDSYLGSYHLQTGAAIDRASFAVRSLDDIDFVSGLGNFFVRTWSNIVNKTTNFIVKAADAVFLQAEKNLALDVRDGDLYLTSKHGKIVLDAQQIIIKSPNNVEFYRGIGPKYFPGYIEYAPAPIIRIDLMRIPVLTVLDIGDPKSLKKLAVTGKPAFITTATIPSIPLFQPIIPPVPLLEYPKAGTGATVPQPNNGVVSTPVYPAA